MDDRENRKMHKAICADCGSETEVPFEPDPNRPVYCRDCFSKRRRDRKFGGGNRGNFRRDSYSNEE